MKLVTPRLVLRDFLAEDLGEYLSVQEDPRFAEFYGPEEADRISGAVCSTGSCPGRLRNRG